MTSIIDTLNTLRHTNSLYNTQMTNNLKVLTDELNNVILKTQTDLINRIAQDYNISARELSKKYLIKPKKNRKTKDTAEDDSPTMTSINDSKNGNYDIEDFMDAINQKDNSDNEDTSIDNVVAQSKKKKGRAKKITETIIDTAEEEKTDEVIYKPITIKNMKYLLDPSTNKIYDMEKNLIGIKKDNKYMMNKKVETVA